MRPLASLLPDITGLTGLVLLAYGCHLAWHPLGYIVPGTLLFGAYAYGEVRRTMTPRSAR